MRVKCRGAYVMSGTSKAGNAYEMCNLVIEKPQETVANAKMKRIGVGLDQQDLEMTETCFERLKNAGFSYPVDLDLTIGAKVGFRGLESVIEDFKPVKLAAAA